MSAPAKINFKIYQGTTFNEVLRWESSVKVYKPITTITKSAPLVITVPSHGVPLEWRVKLTNILGMTELNSDSVYHQVSETTEDTITINAINSLGFKSFISSGVVEYNKPVEMTFFTARMHIREKITDLVPLMELTTENGGITINNTNKSIVVNISASNTASFMFNTAVYSLEIVSGGGQVTPFVSGNFTLVKEVTR